MYPYELFLGLGLYEIFMVLGFFLALLYFRFLADRIGLGAKLQNLVIVCALAALFGGYGCSVLTQAVYNALESGHFEITQSTGATFYGGLVGGTAVFLLVYFVAGHVWLGKGEPRRYLGQVTEIAAGSITVAHAFGRLGCLCAGCCHGRVTDAWYGIYHVYLQQKVIPVQLFEAIFLLALCAFLTWRFFKGKKGNLALYLMLYAVWRFFIEYLRADDRGATIVSFLSPSQFTAIVLFAVGAGLFVWGMLRERKHNSHGA